MGSQKKPKVSVVVPVFNVEQYLPQCLECLNNQTYTNIEIVLVDDESKDGSGYICDQYANNHCNARVVHQKNMGLSGARNIGVKNSTGNYITFVDSDDIISKDYVEILVDALLDTNADISVARIVKFWGEINTPGIAQQERQYEIHKTENAIIEMCYGGKYGVSACCKLYPKDLVEKHPYPVGKLHEDLATTYKIFGDINEIVYCNQYIYFYRQRVNSIMNERFNVNHLYALDAAQAEIDYMITHYPKCETAAKFRYVLEVAAIVSMLLNPTSENRNLFYHIRKQSLKYCKTVLRDKRATTVTKVRAFSLIMGYDFSLVSYRFLKLLKRKIANAKSSSLVNVRM